MKIRSLLLVLFLVLVLAFVALNLDQILQPTSLNLGLATIQAPLGVAMLSLLGLSLLVFAIALAYLQTTHLMELRRAMKEVAEQRGLADHGTARGHAKRVSSLEADGGANGQWPGRQPG